MHNSFKQNILNKSDAFNLYKTESNEYKLAYQNLIDNFNNKNNDDFTEHIYSLNKLNQMEKGQ